MSGTAIAAFSLTGEPALEALANTANGVAVGTFALAGEPTLEALAVGSAGTAAASFTFAGEPELEYAEGEQEVLPGDIGSGKITLTAGGTTLTVPFSGESETETLTNRGTVRPVFGGVAFYDGGYYEVDRKFNIVIENPSRAEVDAMKQLHKQRIVTLVHWDGVYSCWIRQMSANGSEISAELETIATA